MIGGPSDVVVEQNIVRAVPVNAPRDVPVPRQPGAEGRPEPARPQALDEDWPRRNPRRAPMRREPPARAPRPPPSRVRRSSRARRRAAHRASRAHRTAPARRARDPPAAAGEHREPAPPPIVPAAEPAPRRPHPMRRSPTWRSASKPRCAGPARPRAASGAPEPAPDLALDAAASPSAAPRRRRRKPPPGAGKPGAKSKSVLDSLEEEMASLLGRPPEKQ